jgi:hypothetical protein
VQLQVPQRSRPSRAALIDEDQLATVCRIKALRRLRCCALPVCGFREADRRRLEVPERFYNLFSVPKKAPDEEFRDNSLENRARSA